MSCSNCINTYTNLLLQLENGAIKERDRIIEKLEGEMKRHTAKVPSDTFQPIVVPAGLYGALLVLDLPPCKA